MSKSYLEITYRRGKPFAAYLYLERREDDRAHRTRPSGRVLIDFNDDGRAIGIEIPSIAPGIVEDVLQAIRESGGTAVEAAELAPLQAA